MGKMRINEVNVRNQEQQHLKCFKSYCNSLWIASKFLRLQGIHFFYSSLIYVGGGSFIMKGNHDDRYCS